MELKRKIFGGDLNESRKIIVVISKTLETILHIAIDSEEHKWQAICLSNCVCHLVGDKSPNPFLQPQNKKHNIGGLKNDIAENYYPNLKITNKIFRRNKFINKNKSKPNRARPYSYSFRVSETEKKLLDEKIISSGLSLTDYLIRVLQDKPIVSISCGSEILAELKRQGNNLNQAIKNCYFGRNTEKELLSANIECKRLYAKLSAVIGGG